jgi:hypothetical protein
VIKVLQANGIEVASIHNNLLDNEPQLVFMHFWAYGDAIGLATGLRAAWTGPGPNRLGNAPVLPRQYQPFGGHKRTLKRLQPISALPRMIGNQTCSEQSKIMDCAERMIKRMHRPECQSRDHRIPRSHRSAGLAGKATSSPLQHCRALLC